VVGASWDSGLNWELEREKRTETDALAESNCLFYLHFKIQDKQMKKETGSKKGGWQKTFLL